MIEAEAKERQRLAGGDKSSVMYLSQAIEKHDKAVPADLREPLDEPKNRNVKEGFESGIVRLCGTR